MLLMGTAKNAHRASVSKGSMDRYQAEDQPQPVVCIEDTPGSHEPIRYFSVIPGAVHSFILLVN